MSTADVKKRLEIALEMATSFLRELPRTDYLICAITRREGDEYAASGIRTNLSWRDMDGTIKPLTVGSMVDLLVEARLVAEIEQMAAENWRREQPTAKPQ